MGNINLDRILCYRNTAKTNLDKNTVQKVWYERDKQEEDRKNREKETNYTFKLYSERRKEVLNKQGASICQYRGKEMSRNGY